MQLGKIILSYRVMKDIKKFKYIAVLFKYLIFQ